MVAVLNWLAEHWFLIFLLAWFGVFRGVRNFVLDTLERIAIIFSHTQQQPIEKPEHRAVENGTERQWTIGAPGQPPKKPGPCVHRNVTAVVSPADEVVAWLCKTCDIKLPADWAVRQEDL